MDSFYVDSADETVLNVLRKIEIKVARLDICADFDQKFIMSIFSKYIENRRFGGVKTWDTAGNDINGRTYYLGSKISDKFFRMYEKDKQTGDYMFKDRLELVLRDTYATFEFSNDNELIKILTSYMNDIEWIDKEVGEVWDSMKQEACEISPKIRHKKTTVKEKGEYVLNTFGKTLKAYAKMYGTLDITKAISEAVLSQKDLRSIENEKVIKLMKYRKEMSKRRELAQDKADYHSYKSGHKRIEQIQIPV